MADLDYAVFTMGVSREIEALYPHLLAQVDGGKTQLLYGYKVTVRDSYGIGMSYDGARVMVLGTGAAARRAAATVMTLEPETLSVARLDVQETVEVDDADRLIAFLQPRKKYKATVWSTIGDRGMTLYVGAPSSSARLRVYNKSAESGIKPTPNTEYLRVEVQLRDRYADLAFQLVREGGITKVLDEWIARMLSDEDACALVGRRATSSVNWNDLYPRGSEEELDRKRLWIERTVVPAIRRLLLEMPDYETTLRRLIFGVDNNPDSEP